MPLYLFHENGQGDPVGVWSPTGESLYLPDAKQFEARGRQTVPERPEGVDWPDWINRLAGSFNPHVHWSIENYDEAPLPEILSQARATTQYPEPDQSPE